MPLNKLHENFSEIDKENYISTIRLSLSNSDNGWSNYLDSAGINPIDGLEGSPTTTLQQNVSSPLSGNVDFRFTKDSANRQGEGFSYGFSIDNRHLGKVLQISFDAELISANNTYENPIFTPISGTYIISSTTCTVTANHSFIQGQVVTMTFTGATPPPNGNYTITSVTATTFVFTIPSGSAASQTACSYTVTSDLRVSIIQNPTGTPILIEPVNTSIQLGITNQKIKHVATFQTHVSINSYRLCIHVATASTVAYTVDFNNFKVWEPPQILGSVITDWQSYTPTLVSFGTTTNQDFQWRRVGGNIEIQGKWTAGTATGVEARIPLPFGTIDSTRIPHIRIVGNAAYNASASGYFGTYILAEPNVAYLTMGIQTSTGNALTKVNGSTMGNNTYTMFASVPLSGWGSNVVMSSDSGEGRVVIGRAIGGSSATVSTGIPFHFTTTSYDSHSGFTRGTAGNANCFFYTAPISGYYRLNCCVGMNSTNGVSIFVNDIDTILLGQGTNGILTNYSGQVFLNAGQKIDIRPNSGSFTSVANANNFFSIERVSAGSQVIGNTETVNLLYTTASNSHATSNSFLDLIYGTRVRDSHGAYNTTNGIFTAPVSGTYSIYAQVGWAANSTGFRQLSISNIANTDLYYGINLNSSALSGNNGFCNIELDNLPMLAGEQIKIRYFQNSTATLALVSGTTYNRLSITRVGSY